MVFEEKPKDFHPTMDVAACFIRVDDQVLFLKRLPTKPQGNTWGIPGGKFDKGETAEQTAIREIREETGIQIPKESMSYFGQFYVRYPDMDYNFHIFEYEIDKLPEVKYNPKEHAGYRWVTLEEASQMPLIPGEEECIAYVYSSDNPFKYESIG
jgi:mutator protein MutT